MKLGCVLTAGIVAVLLAGCGGEENADVTTDTRGPDVAAPVEEIETPEVVVPDAGCDLLELETVSDFVGEPMELQEVTEPPGAGLDEPELTCDYRLPGDPTFGPSVRLTFSLPPHFKEYDELLDIHSAYAEELTGAAERAFWSSDLNGVLFEQGGLRMVLIGEGGSDLGIEWKDFVIEQADAVAGRVGGDVDGDTLAEDSDPTPSEAEDEDAGPALVSERVTMGDPTLVRFRTHEGRVAGEMEFGRLHPAGQEPSSPLPMVCETSERSWVVPVTLSLVHEGDQDAVVSLTFFAAPGDGSGFAPNQGPFVVEVNRRVGLPDEGEPRCDEISRPGSPGNLNLVDNVVFAPGDAHTKDFHIVLSPDSPEPWIQEDAADLRELRIDVTGPTMEELTDVPDGVEAVAKGDRSALNRFVVDLFRPLHRLAE